MTAFWFSIYLISSWMLLVVLFRLFARRGYFFHLVPFVAGYAAVATVLLCNFGFQDFFWWYLGLSSAFLCVNLSRHLGSKDGIEAFAQLEKKVLAEMPEGEVKQQVQAELAPKRAAKQHVVITVAIFAITVSLVFYVFSDRALL